MNAGGTIHLVNNLPQQLRDLATSANNLANALGAHHAGGMVQWPVAAKCAKDVSEATATVEHFLRVLHGDRGKRGTGQAGTARSKGKQSGRAERLQERKVRARVIRLDDVPCKKEAVSKPGSEMGSRRV